MRTPVVQPRSTRLSWEEAHRLEVMVRARASSLGRGGRSGGGCALCGRPLHDDGVRVGGVVVHSACLAT
jgi:hypothetical protein